MQLIDNIGDYFKLTSVQAAAGTGLLALAEQFIPSLQAVLPPVAYAVLCGVILVARAVKQPKLGA